MENAIRLCIAGSAGRMGHAVAAIAEARAGVALVTRFDREGASEAHLAACDVIIDFSSGGASASLAERAATRGGPALVIGSTGFSAADEAAVRAAAASIPIVKSGNFSVGVNVLAGLVEQTARRLGPELWDIEIHEAHHRRKVDAPSGTALMLGEAAARGRGRPLSDLAVHDRHGITGMRTLGSIGFSVSRGGGIVGEHAVTFAAEEESLTLAHRAHDRGLFARGAVEAAVWVVGRPAGLYDMVDVLGLRNG
jgi:4-hydroxy-tetrahydrodipicolinate reductase